MASTNVETFAAELKVPADVLLEQLKAAGVVKSSAADPLTEADKEQLLTALRAAHGRGEGRKQKITVVRKQMSEIKQADATGKARTIPVEVRKKRTFVKRDAPEAVPAPEPAPAPAPVISASSVIDEEQRRLREEEAKRQQELFERQSRELREKTERLERDRQREIEAAEEAARREEEAKREQERLERLQADGATRERAANEAAKEQEEEVAARAAATAASDAARRAKEAADESAAARRKAEDEVAAINRLLSAARRPAPPPAEAPPPAVAAKPADAAAARRSGTLHRPAAAAGAVAAAPAADATGARKHVKSEKLSSTWQEEAAKRRQIKTRGDSGPSGWRGARGPRRPGDRHGGRSSAAQQAPAEQVVREVHVPETITVADLSHKMSVKATEVIKQLMKLGQMVTINQVLDQETAMIIV